MSEDIDRELFKKLDFCDSKNSIERLIQNIDLVSIEALN